MTQMYMYLVEFPNGVKVKAETNRFAIIAESREAAIEKSLKYGDNGIITQVEEPLNKDW